MIAVQAPTQTSKSITELPSLEYLDALMPGDLLRTNFDDNAWITRAYVGGEGNNLLFAKREGFGRGVSVIRLSREDIGLRRGILHGNGVSVPYSPFDEEFWIDFYRLAEGTED